MDVPSASIPVAMPIRTRNPLNTYVREGKELLPLPGGRKVDCSRSLGMPPVTLGLLVAPTVHTRHAHTHTRTHTRACFVMP